MRSWDECGWPFADRDAKLRDWVKAANHWHCMRRALKESPHRAAECTPETSTEGSDGSTGHRWIRMVRKATNPGEATPEIAKRLNFGGVRVAQRKGPASPARGTPRTAAAAASPPPTPPEPQRPSGGTLRTAAFAASRLVDSKQLSEYVLARGARLDFSHGRSNLSTSLTAAQLLRHLIEQGTASLVQVAYFDQPEFGEDAAFPLLLHLLESSRIWVTALHENPSPLHPPTSPPHARTRS